MTTIVNGVATDAATTDQTPWETVTFTKADVTAAGTQGAWTTANSPITVFTVTGLVRMQCYGVITTAFTSTGGTGTLSLGATGNVQRLISAGTVNGTDFAEGGVLAGATADSDSRMTIETGGGSWYLSNSGDVILTIATNDMTAGGIIFYCQWIPLESGATVVAATP